MATHLLPLIQSGLPYYALSGTDLGYTRYAHWGTMTWLLSSPPPDNSEGAREYSEGGWTTFEQAVCRSAPLSAYARALRCPVLTKRMLPRCAMCGTELAYPPTRSPVLSWRMAIRAARY
eukprot:1841011-Rhodomonas_salina.2